MCWLERKVYVFFISTCIISNFIQICNIRLISSFIRCYRWSRPILTPLRISNIILILITNILLNICILSIIRYSLLWNFFCLNFMRVSFWQRLIYGWWLMNYRGWLLLDKCWQHFNLIMLIMMIMLIMLVMLVMLRSHIRVLHNIFTFWFCTFFLLHFESIDSFQFINMWRRHLTYFWLSYLFMILSILLIFILTFSVLIYWLFCLSIHPFLLCIFITVFIGININMMTKINILILLTFNNLFYLIWSWLICLSFNNCFSLDFVNSWALL